MVTTVNYGLECYYSALETELSLKSTIGDRRSPPDGHYCQLHMVTTVNYGTHKAQMSVTSKLVNLDGRNFSCGLLRHTGTHFFILICGFTPSKRPCSLKRHLNFQTRRIISKTISYNIEYISNKLENVLVCAAQLVQFL